MFSPCQPTARKARSRRLRAVVAVAVATIAMAGIAAGVGTSSASAATPLGCLQFPAGQLCADNDSGYAGYVLATGNFYDGSQRSIYMPADTWNALVNQANGMVTVNIGGGAPDPTTSALISIGAIGFNGGANDIWLPIESWVTYGS